MSIADERILPRLEKVKGRHGSWTALCPAHDDHKRSLGIKEMDGGKISVQCYAGCDIDAILGKIGLKASDLYPDNGHGSGKNPREIVATYDYKDEDDGLVFQVVRYVPKGFSQRQADGNGGWVWNTKGITKPLYLFPELTAAIAAGKSVFLVEGEKDCHALEKIGLVATTNAGGASKWSQRHTEILRQAKKVLIIPDNDEPGQKHAWRIADELPNAVVVNLPGLEPKQDVSDWIEAGGTREQLIALVKQAIENPPERPEPATVQDTEAETGLPAIRNFEYVEAEKGRPQKQALRLLEINEEVLGLSGGWPKRIGELLFVDHGGEVRFLSTVDAFFAWAGEVAPVRWSGGSSPDGATFTPKGEFYAHLRARAENFAQVEALPHEPPIDGVYYAWRPLEGYTADGSHLTRLLEFFDNSETPDDESLIRAMFLTPLWGGLPGTRPAFVIMGPDRGVGKTSLTDALGELYGAMEIEPGRGNQDKTIPRLLSESGLLNRVVRVDNIKGGMSSALIEGLITTTQISGHRMYHGEAKRPNTLTWVLTGNALRLSRDLADRAFIIRLAKPSPRPSWREELFAYIHENRAKIIADVVSELSKEPYRRGASDRWQGWVDAVLSRCTDDPASVVELNQKRRNESDSELEEADVILQAVLDHVAKTPPISGTPHFLKSPEMTEIVNAALHVKWSTPKVAGVLKGHIEAGRIKQLVKSRTKKARGYEVLLNGDA